VSDLLQHLFNGVTTGCILALIALGYTMVYGVLKLINFAHSDVFMVGAFMGYYGAHGLGMGAGMGHTCTSQLSQSRSIPTEGIRRVTNTRGIGSLTVVSLNPSTGWG